MEVLKVSGARIDGICACLPRNAVDNLSECARVCASEARAREIVGAVGINRRRIAADGVSSLDLCVEAAKALLAGVGAAPDGIGAVVCVTFTPELAMPCNACQAQSRLGLQSGIVAFDVSLACSGYAYGLYVASLLARETGKKVLLLDGDVQSAVTRKDDESTVPVLADAGTATLVSADSGNADEWRFAFMSDGAGGEALRLPVGGTVAMDGFAVFAFVAAKVASFIREFLSTSGMTQESFDGFVPHQANVYMARQLAKSLKFPLEKLCISGDEVGNSASATVPVTIAWTNASGRLLVSGFGGGLSASVASIVVPRGAFRKVVEL